MDHSVSNLKKVPFHNLRLVWNHWQASVSNLKKVPFHNGR